MNVNVNLIEENIIQINGGIIINVDVSVKDIIYVRKKYVWNPATCNCENGKYLASVMDDSTIIYDEVIKPYDEEIKTIPINFNEKKVTCKTQNFYILPAFLLIIIALLIAVSIYYYLVKYQTKHLLPFHNTNNELNKFCIDSIN